MRNGTAAVHVGSLDFKRIKRIGNDLNELFAEINTIFPGRHGLTEQLKYALLTRHNLMMFGPAGTGKTDLVNTLFGQIKNAQKTSFALTKFSSEATIYGIPNMKIMNEEGRLHIDTSDPDSIFQSHFVELDEFLDANPPVLRSLLGLLNERVFKRGRNIADFKLHSAVASTNKDPLREVSGNDELFAVVDRFLFQYRVSYLTTKEDRMRMYGKYVNGAVPTKSIEYEDLEYISSVVLNANQITNPLILETYDDIIEAYSKQNAKVTITDRRKCKLIQLIEANALLYGRFEVHPEDILAVKWGLCYGDDLNAHQIFDNIAKPLIEKANELLGQDIDKLQVEYLVKLEETLNQLMAQPIDQNTYFKLAGGLNQLKEDTQTVKPELASTKARLNQLNANSAQFEQKLLEFSRTVK